VPSSFLRFKELPNELQNHVIREAIASLHPIVDLNMSLINMNVLATCKHFRGEDLKGIFKDNLFHFSSIDSLEAAHGLYCKSYNPTMTLRTDSVEVSTASNNDEKLSRWSFIKSIRHLSVSITMGCVEVIDSSMGPAAMASAMLAMWKRTCGFGTYASELDSNAFPTKLHLARADWPDWVTKLRSVTQVHIHHIHIGMAQADGIFR